jgi:hypothetical protein
MVAVGFRRRNATDAAGHRRGGDRTSAHATAVRDSHGAEIVPRIAATRRATLRGVGTPAGQADTSIARRSSPLFGTTGGDRGRLNATAVPEAYGGHHVDHRGPIRVDCACRAVAR